MNTLIQYDIALFTRINGQWNTAFLDWLLPLLRDQYFWSPLYLFLASFMIMNFGKNGFYWVLAFLVTFSIGDIVSSHLIKPAVGRLRPCNDPLLADSVRRLIHCGSGKSFTSSHATNHFALGMFCFKTFVFAGAPWRWMFLFWAMIISYSQVYVGVHFPLDIIGGGILGAMIGWMTGTLFNQRIQLRALA